MSKNVLIFLYTFRRKWMDLKLILDNNGSVIASDILASMKKREEELFGSNVMLAAVYLNINNPYRLSSE